MTDLRTLSARVSEATGPSRELDAEIWLALDPRNTRKQWSYVHEATGRTCEVDETRDATRRLIIVPAYTASLDAVAALIAEKLPGWAWSAGVEHEAFLMPEEPPCSGSVMGNVREWQPAHDEPPEIAYDNYERKAKTPALALLSAALLAIHERPLR